MNRPGFNYRIRARRFALPAALALTALLSFSTAHAQVQSPTTVLAATRDATVNANDPDANFGADKRLVGATAPGGSEQRALVAFDALALPQDSTIQSAELRLELASSLDPTMQIGLRCVLAGWDEDKITWNIHTDLRTVDCLTPAPAPTESPLLFDVTQIVNRWVNAPADQPNEGLLLYPVGRTAGNRIFESRESGNGPTLTVRYLLPPIQVCVDEISQCSTPAAFADVLNLTTGRRYGADSNGYISGADIALGDVLWARHVVASDQTSTRYRTSADEPVRSSRFVLYPGANVRTMRIAVGDNRPLYVRNLFVSSQWHLSENFKAQLANAIRSASNYLYRYTRGQFALGEVTIFQAYQNWEIADVWLYASNTLRPLSYIKGDVAAPTPDPDSANVKFTYLPGQIYIGSYWNRFGLPPAAPLPEPVDVSEDYALALSHELSHYLLGQFDAYLVLTPAGQVETSGQCQGTAMGWVYAAANHGFIADTDYWQANCGNTLANYNLNRTEWATIRQWFPWAQTPGPGAFAKQLPAGITTVQFAAPPPAPPTVGDTYDLLYQAGESASRAARAFLFQNGRVLDQGKPVRGATEITLPMAPFAGDRLCVIDIDPAPAAPHTPRNQYGCELLAAGDSTIRMARDPAWAPFMEIAHPAAATVTISVTQPPVGGTLQARLYPEHLTTPSAVINLSSSGGQWVGSFAVDQVTPAAYVEVWVDETNTEANPRRTAIFDYGIGGGAAPGPQSNVGFAPTATSSDGRSFFMAPPDLAIGASEFIAIQTSGGAPPPPTNLRFVSQSYRLIALPATRVSNGSINIAFGDDTGGITRQSRSGASMDAAGAAIYVWNGTAWQALPTRITELSDSGLLASAPSRGQATYAVLAPTQTQLFIPLVSRQ